MYEAILRIDIQWIKRLPAKRKDIEYIKEQLVKEILNEQNKTTE